jgi:hypothetical protein
VARSLTWRRRAAFGAVAFALSSAIGLGLAEVLVRLVAPQQLIVGRPEVFTPADSVGYRLRPSVDVTLNTGDGPARVRTDSLGFRVGAAGRREGERTVLLIGDSFMAAFQVEHEATVAGLMERALSDALGQPVAVRNAGVPGWDAPQYLTYGRAALGREHVDALVVSVFVGNDVVPRRRDYIPAYDPEPRSGFRVPARFTGDELVQAVAKPLNDWLEQRSHAFVLLKNRLGVLRMRLGLTAVYFPPGYRKVEAQDPMWDVTVGLLDELGMEARRLGIPVMFFLLPYDFQVETRSFDAYVRGFGLDPASVDLDQPNRLLGERLRERGYEVVDATPALRAADAAGTRCFGVVDKHLSAAGHRVVWDTIAPYVTTLFSRSLQATSTAPVAPARSTP